jgi:LacI family transcriptional regulator
MASKATIDDIARLAGVSKATVSRVLNRKPDVDPATRERILRIVEEQNFVPSATASLLARGKSRLLGVLIPSFTQPFIQDVLRGVAETIEQTPYELVLYSAYRTMHDDDKSHVIDNILATKLTAGILAMYMGKSVHHLADLHKSGFPVVVIDDQEQPDAMMPWVSADNITGSYDAVRYLISLGHQRIAHIQGPMQYLCSRERHEGYQRALLEAGIQPDERWVIEGDFQPNGGRLAASTFFALPEEQRPTAIFAANDQMAYGVLSAAEEHELQVPRNIALIGFDDISTSAHIRPPLTTVRQPFFEMGQRGIEALLSLIDAPQSFDAGSGWPSPQVSTVVRHDASHPVRVQFATSLVVRASSGSSLHLTSPTSNVSLEDL